MIGPKIIWNTMTRQQQKQEKLKKEEAFLKSLIGKKLTGLEKNKFRQTTVWIKFRERFKGAIDPITLKKVSKRFQLHHMDLNPEHYTDLKFENFAPLNGTTHDLIHYLYGYYRKDKQILKRIQKLLDKMVEINDGKDICDFKKK